MAAELAPATRKQQISAVRSFLRWTRAFGLHTIGPDVIDVVLRCPVASTTVPYTTLSDAEVAALLHAAKKPQSHALLLVMLGAGLRVSEVSKLDVGDLVISDPAYLVVREGKGGRSRAVPIHPEVVAPLRRLAASRGVAEPLFLRSQGAPGRLQIYGIRDRLAVIGHAAGIRRQVTPHMLRHTYAVRALMHGGNVMAISKLLGHRQLSTTQRYLDHLELPEMLATVPALPSTTP